MIPRFNYYKI